MNWPAILAPYGYAFDRGDIRQRLTKAARQTSPGQRPDTAFPPAVPVLSPAGALDLTAVSAPAPKAAA